MHIAYLTAALEPWSFSRVQKDFHNPFFLILREQKDINIKFVCITCIGWCIPDFSSKSAHCRYSRADLSAICWFLRLLNASLPSSCPFCDLQLYTIYISYATMASDMQLVAEHTLPLLLGIANPQLQESIIVVIPMPWDLLGCPFIQLQHSKALALVMRFGI